MEVDGTSEVTEGWGRVERPDAEIWYVDTAGDLPVVVLLHGLAGFAREWRPVIDALRSDYRVIALEQRGHGGSTRRPADVSRAAYAADVVAVLDDLGADEAVLVGQSMGGHTAMLVAAEHPVRVSGLVLVESGLGGGTPEDLAAVSDWLHSWPQRFEDAEMFCQFFGGDPRVALAWADGLDPRPDGLHRQWDPDVLAVALGEMLAREFLEEWSDVRAPTLLVRGERSTIPERQIESMCALRPDTDVIVLAGTGHDLHLEQPEVLAPVIREFLG